MRRAGRKTVICPARDDVDLGADAQNQPVSPVHDVQPINRKRGDLACGSFGLSAPFSASALSCPSWKSRPKHRWANGKGGLEMLRASAVLIAVAFAASAGSLQTKGETLFRECEFKAAARAFELALTEQPKSALLHFWAG